MKIILFLIPLLCGWYHANAQYPFFTCQDTIRRNTQFVCTGDYEPVCGCDGKTYRNECFAYQKGGLNSYNGGICENFDFDLVPNPVLYSLRFSLALKQRGNCLVQIFNSYGILMYSRSYQAIERLSEDIDVNSYRTGVYLVMVRWNDEMKIKKFIRSSY